MFKDHFTWRVCYTLFLLSGVRFIEGFDRGFLQALWTSGLGDAVFHANKGNLTSAIWRYHVPLCILQIVGVCIGVALMRVGGRRMAFQLLMVPLAIGLLLTSIAPSTVAFGVTRGLLYLAFGMNLAVAPVFMTEIAPAKYRGGSLALFQTLFYFGNFLGYVMVPTVETIDPEDSQEWHRSFTPWSPMFGFGIILILVVTIGTTFCPNFLQCPRWNLLHCEGQIGQGYFHWLHEADPPVPHPSWADMQAAWDARREPDQPPRLTYTNSLRHLWKAPRHLPRTVIAILHVLCFHANGPAFLFQFFQTLQDGDQAQVARLGSTIYAVCAATIFTFAFMVDSRSRRLFLCCSSICMAACLLAVSVLGWIGRSTEGIDARTYLAPIYIGVASFSAGWAPLIFAVITEIPSLELRDYTQLPCQVLFVAFDWALELGIRHLFQVNTGPDCAKRALAFVVLSLFSFSFSFYFTPAAYGQSLEDIDSFAITFRRPRTAQPKAPTSLEGERNIQLPKLTRDGRTDDQSSVPRAESSSQAAQRAASRAASSSGPTLSSSLEALPMDRPSSVPSHAQERDMGLRRTADPLPPPVEPRKTTR